VPKLKDACLWHDAFLIPQSAQESMVLSGNRKAASEKKRLLPCGEYPAVSGMTSCGEYRIRTGDLLTASQTL
jgi:hypothetical protein